MSGRRALHGRILKILASLLESATNSSPVTSAMKVSVVQSGVYLTVSLEDGNTGTAVLRPPSMTTGSVKVNWAPVPVTLLGSDAAPCVPAVFFHMGRPIP